LDNYDNKRGQEILEHLDIVRFTKAEVSETIESTQGEICIKKRSKDLETCVGLRTNV